MNKLTIPAAAIGLLAGSAVADGNPGARFSATHEFAVAAPVGAVFELFLPDGESRWVPTWQPTPVVPDTIRAEENAVFLTEKDGRTVVWTIIDYAPERHAIDYLVVDPGYQQRLVSVRCRETGPGASAVRVTYVSTALSAAGAAGLGRYDENFIRSWEEPVRKVATGS